MTPLLDFIVTGASSPDHAKEIRNVICELAKRHPAVGTVGVFHWCANPDAIIASNVSELDWLLYNAASAKFIAHLDSADILNIRNSTFLDLTKAMTGFDPQAHIRGARASPGRIIVPMLTPIRGIQTLYYNNHNNERKLRFMDGNFGPRIPHLAILVPMTLRGLQNNRDVPFLRYLGPSLQKTLCGTDMFKRSIYLGIDEDEVVDESVMQRILLRNRSCQRTKYPVRVIRIPPEYRHDENHSRMYNLLYLHAVMDGNDFSVQLQDDARLETMGWDRFLAANLCANPLALGAFSMMDRWSSSRLDNVMVSRTHFDVFGHLFNPAAPDPSVWLSQVYGSRAQVMGRIKVTNMIQKERRKRNHTDQVYANYGKSLENGDGERELFANIISRCIAAAM